MLNELLLTFAQWLDTHQWSTDIHESIYMYSWIEATHVSNAYDLPWHALRDRPTHAGRHFPQRARVQNSRAARPANDDWLCGHANHWLSTVLCDTRSIHPKHLVPHKGSAADLCGHQRLYV